MFTLLIYSLPQSKNIKLSYPCNHSEFFRTIMFDSHLTMFDFIPDRLWTDKKNVSFADNKIALRRQISGGGVSLIQELENQASTG